MKIKVAQIKYRSQRGALAENQAQLMTVLEEIVAQGPVDVVVTPECHLDGYVNTDVSQGKGQIRDYAIDPATCSYCQAIGHWAQTNSAWVMYGCSRIDGDQVFNSVLIYSAQGDTVGSYNKIHLQKEDRDCYTPGTHLNTYDSEFGKFGVMICADRRWPETSRTMAIRGARVIFNPTDGMRDDRNTAMMRTRSYENNIFITFTHPEKSLITGPLGDILCENTDEGSRFVITEIDLSQSDAAAQEEMGHLKDRHPEVYAP